MAFGLRGSSSWHIQLALWALLLHHAILCLADNVTNPMSIFYTHPDLQTPIITVDRYDERLVTPGYIFFGVYQATQEGPLIYDQRGNLVWNGFGSSGPGIAHAIHVCNYKNKPHLCFYQGTQMIGYGKGHGVIMDNHYQIVKTVEPAGKSMTVDLHEFTLTPDGRSALMTIYHPQAYDLSAYGITDGMGWIQDSIFQEVNVETDKLIFEWRSLDHIDPSESWVPPATTEISGDGSTKDTPWDYFHINSVDKNADGDYLISARHVSALYKISGKDGSIMWRLNGAKSDFKLKGFTFSSQHDARWISENRTHTVLSIYDNASNGFNETYTESRGMIIVIDHTTEEAELLKAYAHPHEEGEIAKSQGNTQILSNGNVVQGWGPLCEITEHTADGETVFWAWVARTGMMIYRVYKANWTAEPDWDPSIWSYSKEQHDTVFYASWNGATEVTHWNFYGSLRRDGPFKLVKSVEKDGFETKFRNPEFSPYVYVEAVSHGSVLRQSPVEKTFVPGDTLRPQCDDFKCGLATPLQFDENAARVKAEEDREHLKQQLQAEAALERAKVFAAKKSILYQLAAGSAGFTALFLMSRKLMRNRLFGVMVTLRDMCTDLLHGRYPDRFRRNYVQLPIMSERQS